MHKLISFLGTINLYLIYTEWCLILMAPAQKSMFTLSKQLKAFFATYQPKKPTTSRTGSLTRDTLINMALRITLVVSVSAAVSYLHVVSNLETQTQEQLEKYIVERGQKESSLFLLAQDNHNLPEIQCYPGSLNQVFMNLLANAIDALEESFAVSHLAIPQIKITTETINNEVVIKIIDNGIGMSEQVQKRLFDPLFTTKPTGKGTGLGLSIAQQIVEDKHKGRLTVVSVAGQGCEFTIVLP